jgi:hypothetical protein
VVRFQRAFILICFVLAMVAISPGNAIEFAREVQPILARHCLECHGPDKQKSGYRVDDQETAFRGGDSGSNAIVAGKSAASGLFQRITTTNSTEMMPPKGARLSAEEVASIRRWIDSGADWPAHFASLPTQPPVSSKHWSFQAIQRPAVPSPRHPRFGG